MKRILVTGLTGFIGRHCLPELLVRGFEVHGISSELLEDSFGVHWHQADLLSSSRKELAGLVRRVQPSHLLHLAWVTKPGEFWSSEENHRWQSASTKLFEEAARANVGRLIGLGSCAEYEWQDERLDEWTTALKPNSIYGQAKNATHAALNAIAHRHERSAAWCRVFFIYGPHAHPDRMPGVVIRSLLEGGTAQCSSGEQRRDFIHVRDAASAIASVVDSNITGPVNIGTGTAIRVRSIATTAARQLDCEDRVEFGAVDANPNEPSLICATTNRLNNELGWTPSFDLENGITDTIQWWQDSLISRRAA